jgi:ABC-2 type transport system permease protein
MSSPVSRGAIITALLKKEFIAYSRDKLYLFLTALTVVAVVSVFWLLPDSVEESITLAVSPPVQTMVEDARETLKAMGATDEQLAELDEADLTEGEEGIALVEFESAEQMAAVIEGTLEAYRTNEGALVFRDPGADEDKPKDAHRMNVDIGIAFPETFISDVAAKKDGVRVTIYSDAAVPEEIEGAMHSFVREMAYQFAGVALPVGMPDADQIVLGEDRVGNQVTMREKMRPMLAFMILLIETFSMSSLISLEVAQRTVTAVLVTPAKVADFLIAKTVFGTGLSLVQGTIVLALVGAFTPQNWSILLATLLVGAMMFTGVALFVGSAGKDFMGQLFYTMMFTIPLLIPSFSVLFPGSAAPWVKVIPSYPVLDTLVNTTMYGAGWDEAAGSLAYGLVWVVVLYGIGLFALKRKVESL